MTENPTRIAHKKPKTIEEHQKRYRKQGPDAVNPLKRQLAEMAIDHQLPERIDNHDYGDALFLTDLMFRHTDRSISILTGSSGGEFLRTLRESFEGAIRRIAELGGKVRIIQLNHREKPQFFPSLREKYPETFEFKFGRASEEIEHFIICDQMVRVESPHSELGADSDPSEINADVWFNNEIEADDQQAFFDIVWKRLSRP